MRFDNGKFFEIGRAVGAASYLHILTPELSDQVLKNFLDTEENMLINMHIEPLDQTNAIKMVKTTRSCAHNENEGGRGNE